MQRRTKRSMGSGEKIEIIQEFCMILGMNIDDFFRYAVDKASDKGGGISCSPQSGSVSKDDLCRKEN